MGPGSPSRRIQPLRRPVDHRGVRLQTGTDPRDRPYPAVPGRRGALSRRAGVVGLPLLGLLGTGAAVALAPRDVVVVVLLVVALAVSGVLGVVLATSVRARRAAETTVADLVAELEAARDERVKDEVTGLLNRQGLLLLGHQVLESARRSGGAVHACVIEITPGVVLGGGPRGPEDLRRQREGEWQAVGTALRGATRTSDVVCREDEGRFLVLGPGAGLHAQELERRVRVGLAQGRLTGGGDRSSRMSVEVGAAVLAPWDDGDVNELLVRAQQSLSQRRALRRSAPQHGWGRRRADRSAPRPDASRSDTPRSDTPRGDTPRTDPPPGG